MRQFELEHFPPHTHIHISFLLHPKVSHTPLFDCGSHTRQMTLAQACTSVALWYTRSLMATTRSTAVPSHQPCHPPAALSIHRGMQKHFQQHTHTGSDKTQLGSTTLAPILTHRKPFDIFEKLSGKTQSPNTKALSKCCRHIPTKHEKWWPLCLLVRAHTHVHKHAHPHHWVPGFERSSHKIPIMLLTQIWEQCQQVVTAAFSPPHYCCCLQSQLSPGATGPSVTPISTGAQPWCAETAVWKWTAVADGVLLGRGRGWIMASTPDWIMCSVTPVVAQKYALGSRTLDFHLYMEPVYRSAHRTAHCWRLTHTLKKLTWKQAYTNSHLLWSNCLSLEKEINTLYTYTYRVAQEERGGRQMNRWGEGGREHSSEKWIQTDGRTETDTWIETGSQIDNVCARAHRWDR